MWMPTHVQLTVQRAKGLLVKGKHGTNDCFVVISLGKEKFQTSVKEKASPEVDWCEECELTIPQQGNKADIKLTVLHRNFLGVDEFLGQTLLPLTDFDTYERPRNRWYQLHSKPGKTDQSKQRGALEVRVAFTVKAADHTPVGGAGGSGIISGGSVKRQSSLIGLNGGGNGGGGVGGSLANLGQANKKKIKKIAASVGHRISKASRRHGSSRSGGSSSPAAGGGVDGDDLSGWRDDASSNADPGVISEGEEGEFGFYDNMDSGKPAESSHVDLTYSGRCVGKGGVGGVVGGGGCDETPLSSLSSSLQSGISDRAASPAQQQQQQQQQHTPASGGDSGGQDRTEASVGAGRTQLALDTPPTNTHPDEAVVSDGEQEEIEETTAGLATFSRSSPFRSRRVHGTRAASFGKGSSSEPASLKRLQQTQEHVPSDNIQQETSAEKAEEREEIGAAEKRAGGSLSARRGLGVIRLPAGDNPAPTAGQEAGETTDSRTGSRRDRLERFMSPLRKTPGLLRNLSLNDTSSHSVPAATGASKKDRETTTAQETAGDSVGGSVSLLPLSSSSSLMAILPPPPAGGVTTTTLTRLDSPPSTRVVEGGNERFVAGSAAVSGGRTMTDSPPHRLTQQLQAASREQLVQQVLQLHAELKHTRDSLAQAKAQTSDMQEYLDALLVRVMETHPDLLHSTLKTSSTAGKYITRAF